MKRRKCVGVSKDMLFLLNLLINEDSRLCAFIMSALMSVGLGGLSVISKAESEKGFYNKSDLIDALAALGYYEIGEYKIEGDEIRIRFNSKFVEHK